MKEKKEVRYKMDRGWRSKIKAMVDELDIRKTGNRLVDKLYIEDVKDTFIDEIEKIEELGRNLAIHEISKGLDIEITRWRSDEDGEFDVLRIGNRYFRSTDVDDYSSSIEAIQETDFVDYESLD